MPIIRAIRISYYVGELVNHCAEPIGIELKVRARDSTGKVMDTDESWPSG
jgi:hypothetical protein